MKTCYKCKQEKPLNCYHRDRQRSSGLRPYCKECEQKKTRTAEYKKQRSHPKYQAIRRKFKLKSYGLTVDQYKNFFDKQFGKCAICKIHQRELPKELSVDHSHNTDKVRGLLCNNCNTGLGFFKDSTERLQDAISYLVNAQ